MNLALNNLQRLICHKTQPTNILERWNYFDDEYKFNLVKFMPEKIEIVI